MPTWPSGSKASLTTTNSASDSISGARADIHQNISNVNDVIDIFNIPASPTDGHILVYDTDTGVFETTNTIEGTPGNHTNPLLHLKSKTQGFNKSQLKASDSTGEIWDLLGRYNPGNGHYQFYVTFDPSTQAHPTGAFAGDKAYVFQYDSTDDEIRTDIFGAGTGAGHVYSTFGDFTTGYQFQNMTFRAKNIEFQPDDGTTGYSSKNGLKVTQNFIDTQGLTIRDTSGGLTFDDNTFVSINSGGTVSFTVENSSATALGQRITVGESSTAHTSGNSLLIRRGTGSGFEEQLKVETDSSTTKVTARGLQLTGATVDSNTSFTQSNRLQININGTDYYIPLDAV